MASEPPPPPSKKTNSPPVGTYHGISALMAAVNAKYEDVEMVKVLLANGAALNRGDVGTLANIFVTHPHPTPSTHFRP